jgi:hypothetical protein
MPAERPVPLTFRLVRAAATILLTILVLALASGCGDDEGSDGASGESTPTTPVVEPVATAPTAPADEQKPAKAAEVEKEAAEPDPEEAVREACPPGFSESKCREFADAIAKSGGSRIVKSGKCPFKSKRRCREFARAIKKVGPSRVTEGGKCRPPFTQAECEELARQHQEANSGG